MSSETQDLQSVYRPGLFQDKTAFVTGGGSGLGLRTARELGRLGAFVVIGGRNEEKLQLAQKELEAEGTSCLAVPVNIRDEESVQRGVQEILKSRPRIDLLLNNAGGQFPAPAEDIKTKGWNAVLDTNLTGTFLVSRAVFQACMKERGGSIVNVLMNMRSGFPMMAHSGAARAGAANLTMTLANEWGQYGVRVNAVSPGIIHTSGLDTYDESFRNFALAAAKNNQTTRLGTQAEVAAGIIFLFSPGAAYITGQNLFIDGGESIYSPMMPPRPNDRHPPFEP